MIPFFRTFVYYSFSFVEYLFSFEKMTAFVCKNNFDNRLNYWQQMLNKYDAQAFTSKLPIANIRSKVHSFVGSGQYLSAFTFQ